MKHEWNKGVVKGLVLQRTSATGRVRRVHLPCQEKKCRYLNIINEEKVWKKFNPSHEYHSFTLALRLSRTREYEKGI